MGVRFPPGLYDERGVGIGVRVQHHSARRGCCTLQSARLYSSCMAVSSRGLGHGPLKAGTRVRIPLPLPGRSGSFVYRLGRYPFKVERRVRLPYGLCGSSDSLTVGQSGGTMLKQMVVGGAGGAGRTAVTRGAGAGDRIRWRHACHASPDCVRGRSSVWLEHSTVTREVAGSSPVGPVL